MAGNEWQVPILVAAIRAVALAALGAPRHGSAASPVNRQPGTFLFVVDPQRTPSVPETHQQRLYSQARYRSGVEPAICAGLHDGSDGEGSGPCRQRGTREAGPGPMTL